jgi:hypothetical protein
MLDQFSGPALAMPALAESTEVGYYEPRSCWTLAVNQLAASDFAANDQLDSQQQEWKPKPYTVNMILIGNDGNEVGVGSLEYMPPHVKKVAVTVVQVKPAHTAFDSDSDEDAPKVLPPPKVTTETQRELIL